jgi:hypothetical protein
MRASRAALLLAVVAVSSNCGSDKTRPPAQPAGSNTASAALPESLALRTRGGIEVWFTLARQAADSSGRPCVERVMEIRRDDKRIPIPLLYTGQPPTLVNDSTIQATIWLHCRPGNVYRVDLRTGRPTRVP